MLGIAAATLTDIRKRIEAPARSKFAFSSLMLGDQEVVQATHHREVPPDQHGKEFKGVVAYAPEPVLVGNAHNEAAIFNMLPDPSTTEDEVNAFVETLVAHGNVAFDAKKSAASALSALPETTKKRRLSKYPTHVIVTSRGKKVLTRVRYACS